MEQEFRGLVPQTSVEVDKPADPKNVELCKRMN